MPKVSSEKFFSFSEANEFLQDHCPQVNSIASYIAYVKSPERDPRMPTNPNMYYARRGEWPEEDGWAAFLGKRYIESRKRFLSYDEAKAFLHAQNITSQAEYKELLKVGDMALYYPKAPQSVYATAEGGFSWFKFLAPKYITFDAFIDFFIEQNIYQYQQWQIFSSSGKRPSNVPANPFRHYGKKFKEIKMIAADRRAQLEAQGK